jgi:hypothetical protein
MAKINPGSIRRQMAADLRLLGEILQQKAICPDSGPLLSAASQCVVKVPYGADSWGYEMVGLQFRSELKRNIFPEGVADISIALSLSVSGMLGSSVSLRDIIRHMALDIVMSGRQFKDGEAQEVRACWHLDRHVGEDSRDEGVHPLFHFQHGGKLMDSFRYRLGSALLMDSPRLIHPPMDTFIAVDFVLSNFLPGKWAEIRSEGAFVNRLGKSYLDYWAPFFEAIAEAWNPSPLRKWASYEALCPQLSAVRKQ